MHSEIVEKNARGKSRDESSRVIKYRIHAIFEINTVVVRETAI